MSKSRDGAGGHRKPSGTTGWLGPGPSGLEYKRLELPGTKAELEAFIVNKILSSGAFEAGKIPWPERPVQEEEQSFDFRFPSSAGAYLELLEIVDFDEPGGYARVALQRQAYFYFMKIWREISKKAARYGSRGGLAVHLVFYTTDSVFTLPPPITEALAFAFATVDRGFASVVYICANGAPEVVVPWAGVRPSRSCVERLRRISFMQSDVSAVEITGPSSGFVAARRRRGDPGNS